MLAGQAALVALTIAGNVDGVALLQLGNLLLDLLPPAQHRSHQPQRRHHNFVAGCPWNRRKATSQAWTDAVHTKRCSAAHACQVLQLFACAVCICGKTAPGAATDIAGHAEVYGQGRCNFDTFMSNDHRGKRQASSGVPHWTTDCKKCYVVLNLTLAPNIRDRRAQKYIETKYKEFFPVMEGHWWLIVKAPCPQPYTLTLKLIQKG